MQQYLDLLQKILNEGVVSGDRTGTGTKRVIAEAIRFDLSEGFPLVTTKKMFLKGIIVELLWFISGDTNIRPLVTQGVNIWNEWPFSRYLMAHGVDPKQLRNEQPDEWKRGIKSFAKNIAEGFEFSQLWGDLGPVYGFQWRHWRTPDGGEIDQLAQAIDAVKNNPTSRRMIVTAWNPADIDEMAISGLPPCHLYFQFSVVDGRLNCTMLQRSVDSFLGLPFNIASYALLTMMVAHVAGLTPGELVLFLVDTHVYLNHIEQVEEQVSRKPYQLPKLVIERPINSIDDFTLADFELIDYQHYPPIKGEISV